MLGPVNVNSPPGILLRTLQGHCPARCGRAVVVGDRCLSRCRRLRRFEVGGKAGAAIVPDGPAAARKIPHGLRVTAQVERAGALFVSGPVPSALAPASCTKPLEMVVPPLYVFSLHPPNVTGPALFSVSDSVPPLDPLLVVPPTTTPPVPVPFNVRRRCARLGHNRRRDRERLAVGVVDPVLAAVNDHAARSRLSSGLRLTCSPGSGRRNSMPGGVGRSVDTDAGNRRPGRHGERQAVDRVAAVQRGRKAPGNTRGIGGREIDVGDRPGHLLRVGEAVGSGLLQLLVLMVPPTPHRFAESVRAVRAASRRRPWRVRDSR